MNRLFILIALFIITHFSSAVNSTDAKTQSNSINYQLPKSVRNAQLHYSEALHHLSENNNKLAYEKFILSKKEYKMIDSLDKVNQINLKIVSLLVSLESTNVNYKPFLDEAVEYAKKKNNPKYLSDVYTQIGKSFYDSLPNIAISYFKKAKNENLKANDTITYGVSLRNLGATYAHDKIMKIDSALMMYEKALDIFKKKKSSEEIYYTYINKGKAFWKKKNYTTALVYYKKADSIPVRKFENKNKAILYEFMSETYKSLDDYKNAFAYNEKVKVYKDSLDEKEQEIALNKIDAQYSTTKTKLENKKLKTKQTALLISLGILLIVLTIGTLTYKNLSKKKKIIEQEKLLETQKLETTLREQELHEIDVMLESQEKERQRIANELHDNLGSMLATLKLNFENLKRNENQPENQLFEKTDELIEEAYQKVRNISHLKNLGVIGSEGLVVSVKKMAEKMSVLEKLKMNVIPHGLSERLENTLEVMIFRIIQELCTNVIKHSEATEVNIYMTQHNGTLNIIIEDNGKGFDPKTIAEKSGIGLKNIEKKVEQMNGTFDIDSIISKGTTIIIDLPI